VCPRCHLSRKVFYWRLALAAQPGAAMTTHIRTIENGLQADLGNHVRIPNATDFKGVIVNYTRKPERRFDFTVGVDTGADLLATQQLAVERLGQADGALDDPPPASQIQALSESNAVF